MANTMTRLQEIYNEAYRDKAVEHIKFGDVQFYINAAIYQAEESLKHWQEKIVEYKMEEKEALEEWCQGKIEGKVQEITNLQGLLKNLKRCK